MSSDKTAASRHRKASDPGVSRSSSSTDRVGAILTRKKRWTTNSPRLKRHTSSFWAWVKCRGEHGQSLSMDTCV
eukprot:7377756-Prymnesium_polylepis.1